MIEACKFINDKGIYKLRLSKERDLDRSNIYAVIRKYLKTNNLFTGRKLKYKGYEVKVARSVTSLNYQAFTIETDNKDILEELEYRKILFDNEYIRVEACIEYTVNDTNKYIDINRTTDNVMLKYQKQYFSTSEKYVDVILAVNISNIVKEVINVIDTISEEDKGEPIIETII